jgi:hypothetical protein
VSEDTRGPNNRCKVDDEVRKERHLRAKVKEGTAVCERVEPNANHQQGRQNIRKPK